SYLDKTGIVSPQKIGNAARPTCLYSWEQLVELRIIYRLRQDASLQQLRQAKEYLKEIGDTESLASKTVVALNNKIYLVSNRPGEIEKLVVDISGKNQGQIIIHSLLKVSEIVSELWDVAKEGKVADFANRAKDKAA
ncbi:MAG TPA: hypothetical protein VIQ31_14275, partial [Phormidium sp.]